MVASLLILYIDNKHFKPFDRNLLNYKLKLPFYKLLFVIMNNYNIIVVKSIVLLLLLTVDPSELNSCSLYNHTHSHRPLEILSLTSKSKLISYDNLIILDYVKIVK